MTLRKFIILAAVCSALAVNIFAQVKEVTEREFTEKLFLSYEKDSENPFRKKKTIETFQEGKLLDTVIIVEESIKPDKSRELRTSIFNGEKDVVETIEIGDSFYCRQNSKPWRKLTYPCHSFFDRDDINEEGGSKYSVEKVNFNSQEVELYREYATFKGYQTEIYFDSKFWITNDGFILKRVIEISDSKSGVVFRRMTELIEYNPEGLKIEAPELENNDVSEKEFQEILNKAETLKQGKAYRRVRFTMVLKEEGMKLVREYTMIDEILPPDQRYYYYRDEGDGLITTSEEIIIGKKYFERNDGGKWKTTVTGKYGSPGGEKIKEEVKTIKFLGTEKYKDKTFRLYEMFEKFSSNYIGDIERTIRYRFDEKGLLWSKTKSERNLRDNNVIFFTDTYDFDAKIKIEVPIVGKKEKP